MLEEIIQGCRKRHRKSQEELYREYHAYGMSITLRYAESRSQAVTILNDAFMKVFENIRSFDVDRPFKPWFRKIVIHTSIDHYHKIRKQQELYSVNLKEEVMAFDETAFTELTYSELIELVQGLTPGYRAVFNLHVMEGFTHEEIAGMLDITAGTSKSNLAKAKRNLRRLIEKNNIIKTDAR